MSDGGAILTWSAGDDLKDEEDGDSSRVRLPSAHYEVYYKSIGDNSTSASVFESDKVTLYNLFPFYFTSCYFYAAAKADSRNNGVYVCRVKLEFMILTDNVYSPNLTSGTTLTSV